MDHSEDKPDWVAELMRALPGRASTDGAARADLSTDFGRMLVQRPAVVVRPQSTGEVQEAVRFAAKRLLRITPRGAGHSQGGQSLSDQIALNLQDLNRVLHIDRQGRSVRCQAGITWRALLDTLLPEGLSPPVLTNNLDVTVGGSISTAGLGVASWRFGTQADHCLECEVVTGSGEVVRCSPNANRELFDSVRAGLGQFGIVTEVTLRLRHHKARVRRLCLLYDDLNALLADLQILMREERFDYLEAWCTPLVQGFRTAAGQLEPLAQWFFPLHAIYESESPTEAIDASKLQGLRFYRHVHTDDSPTGAFFSRLDPLFALWKQGGFWDCAHPWMEYLLPWISGAAYVTRIIESIPPQALLGGHVLLWPGRTAVTSAPLFIKPSSELVLGFGILLAVPPGQLVKALPALEAADAAAIQLGAKRYLSGWVNFTQSQWQAHYGDLYPKLLELKRHLDLHSVFPRHFGLSRGTTP